MRNSTMTTLVEELEELNTDEKYNQLIANAKSGRYHDYKNPDDVPCGKIELVRDLDSYPELADIRAKVIDGYYDEEADEEDKEAMRESIPQSMWKALGLD